MKRIKSPPLRNALRWMPLVLTISAANAQERSGDGSEPASIEISELTRNTPVDFQIEILPILKDNCLACHNQTKAKADLILETPQTILRGGDSGPAVIPNRGSDSLLLQAAAHMGDTVMPPQGNKVNAKDLSSQQLGLLKLWIDQGAKGEVRDLASIEWKPLPETFNPIFAVAVTPDGQFAACGRGNQIFLYHLPTNRLVTRLIDPSLNRFDSTERIGAAHRDVVNSLAFSPDSALLASGGYRQVKLWRRSPRTPEITYANQVRNAEIALLSPNGEWLAFTSPTRGIRILDTSQGREIELAAPPANVTLLEFSRTAEKLAAATSNHLIRIWTVRDGNLHSEAQADDAIHAIAWLADDDFLATGDATGIIHIWKVPDPSSNELEETKQLESDDSPITCLEPLGDSPEFISGSADGTLRKWNRRTGELIREFAHDNSVTLLATRSDGKRFVSAGPENGARLWNSADGELIAELNGDRYAEERAVLAQRLRVFSGDEVEFRKAALRKAEKDLKAEEDRLKKSGETLESLSMTFAEKEMTLASAKDKKSSAEEELKALEEEVKTVTAEYEAAEKAMREAQAKATAALEELLRVKIPADVAAENSAISERFATDAAVIAARVKASISRPDNDPENGPPTKLAEDSAYVAARAQDITRQIAEDAERKKHIAEEAMKSVEKAIEALAHLSFSAGQIKPRYDKITVEGPETKKKIEKRLEAATKAIAEAESEFEKARLAKTGVETDVELTIKLVGRRAEDLDLAKTALTDSEAEAQRAETELANALEAAKVARTPVLSVAFSEDDSTVATTDGGESVRTWSAETGAPIEAFSAKGHSLRSISIADNSKLIAGTSTAAAVEWDLAPEWTLSQTIGTGGKSSAIVDRVNALAFSPDGEHLATGGGEPSRSGEVKIWKVTDGALIRSLTDVHSDSVLALDFSSDGKFLASGAADRFVRIVEFSTGRVTKSLEGHTHHVLGVSWKHDGRTLASAGADNVVKIWNIITGEIKKNITGFDKEVTSIRFIGTSDRAAVCSGDSQVVLVKEDGEKIRSLEGTVDFMHSVAVTPDGKRIVAGGQDSVLRVWDGTDGKTIGTFGPPHDSSKLANTGTQN